MMNQEDVINQRDEIERQHVKTLGLAIGFGRLFQLGQEEWEKANKAFYNMPAGMAFAYGPCLSATVPCKCTETVQYEVCDWCCGALWVTKKVRALQG